MSTVAAIQMCSSYIVKDNLINAEKLIKTASNQGAGLIVLPEMFAIMGKNPSDKVLCGEEFGGGEIQDFLSCAAKENKAWLVGGTIPIACSEKDKIRAASLVYDDAGRCMARYDKIHLFDATISESESYKESDTTQAGDQVVVVDTPFGRLGLAVCYDLRFPYLFDLLREQGAEIIAVPSAFTYKTGEAHWQLLSRCRAIDTFCYIIGACQGGLHANGRKTYGHSLIVDPWGQVIREQDGCDSGVVYTSIKLSQVHEVRKSIPTTAHRLHQKARIAPI
jgi:deaminated glutathione amidase